MSRSLPVDKPSALHQRILQLEKENGELQLHAYAERHAAGKAIYNVLPRSGLVSDTAGVCYEWTRLGCTAMCVFFGCICLLALLIAMSIPVVAGVRYFTA